MTLVNRIDIHTPDPDPWNGPAKPERIFMLYEGTQVTVPPLSRLTEEDKRTRTIPGVTVEVPLMSERLAGIGLHNAARVERNYEQAREFFGMSVSELKHDVRGMLAEGLDLDDVTPGKMLELAMVRLHQQVQNRALTSLMPTGKPAVTVTYRTPPETREDCQVCHGNGMDDHECPPAPSVTTALVTDILEPVFSLVATGTGTGHVLTNPAPPAYKDGQVWRCGQPCVDAPICGGICYHPVEVPHGDDHGCCERIRLQVFARMAERNKARADQDVSSIHAKKE